MNKDAIDLLVSFDTTGSMYPCLSQVRRQVQDMVNRLFRDIPNLRVGIIAHGDYCDAPRTITKFDFSTDQRAICDFVRNVRPTHGGDMPECYELVLHEARTFSWSAGKTKAMVMIGDDVPHGPHERQNAKGLDWRNELDLLLEAGVHVVAVQALARYHATSFWKEVAKRTGGFHLALNQFADVVNLLLAVAYKQAGDEQLFRFEQEVQESGRYSPHIEIVFTTLSEGKSKGRTVVKRKRRKKRSKLAEVNPSRFQAIEVDEDCDIRSFVEDMGITFRPGRGFYQLTKAVNVQDHKEVILEDGETGEMFSGPAARKMLGLPERGTVRLNPRFADLKVMLDKYVIYIQSTSYNRKLLEDTWFLYEIEDWDRAAA